MDEARGKNRGISGTPSVSHLHTMPYQHLGAPYESSVTDRHKIWLDKRDLRDDLKNGTLSILHIFLTEKRAIEQN